MKRQLAEWLCCPRCQGDLELEVSHQEAGEIESGTLVCRGCSRSYPIVRFIPRFVESEAYAQSFGREWQWFGRTQLDGAESQESWDTFFLKTGFTPGEMTGKAVLDVGCGMGRFLDVASRAGAEVIGIDLSLAVESAYQNLGSRPDVHIVQADALFLPFRPATFDLVYSLGVLHHTPDTRAAFRPLPRVLRANGKLALWVYSRPIFAMVSDVLRKVTTRIQPHLLFQLCRVAIPLYYVHRLPIVGRITRILIPTSMHPKAAWRHLDTFDWYSPKYQWFHTPGEVVGWFREAGFQDIAVLSFPVSVTGVKGSSG